MSFWFGQKLGASNEASGMIMMFDSTEQIRDKYLSQWQIVTEKGISSMW